MNNKIYIYIGIGLASLIVIGGLLYLAFGGKSDKNKEDSRSRYIRLLSGNLAEQLNTYSYNNYSDIRIAQSQSTDKYKATLEQRIAQLEAAQSQDKFSAAEANRDKVSFVNTESGIVVTVPVRINLSGQISEQIWELSLVPVGKDWLLDNAKQK